MLIGQSRHPRSPFYISDESIKQASRRWKSEARTRIRRADMVIVICGLQTHRAVGVTTEIDIARAEGKPDALLRGRRRGWVRRPRGAWFWETMHDWTWDNLRVMTTGKR